MDRSRQWTGRSRGGGFGHRFFIFLIRKAGIGFAYGFLALVVLYFVPCAPRATRAVWFYARRVLGYGWLRSVWHLFAHYYCFGRTLIDKIAIGAGQAERYRFEFDNYSEFLQILDGGSGVVMIGAHVGSWEAGSHFFGDYARRMNIVLYDGEAAGVKRALENNAAGPRFKIISLGDGLDSVVRIKNALDAGEYVCFQGDRHLGSSSDSTVAAGFMGRAALFPRGPFRIASRMGVPVVFFFAMREKGRVYRFHFVEARQKTERGLLDEYLRTTETIVRAHPTQWFNFYNFWQSHK
jgi:predicted LPLAT superfamily acyltransferase